MERSQIGLESRSECGFLHALMQLEKMWMTGADPDPKNVRQAFAGKLSEARNRKKECLPRESAEVSFERLFGMVPNVTEKTESQMHLLGRKPSHTAHFRIQAREEFCNGLRKLDADEEPFRAHSWRRNSQPERDASPSGSPGGGSTVLITFIMLPAMFGNSALPRIVARAISGIVSDGKPRRHAEMI